MALSGYALSYHEGHLIQPGSRDHGHSPRALFRSHRRWCHQGRRLRWGVRLENTQPSLSPNDTSNLSQDERFMTNNDARESPGPHPSKPRRSCHPHGRWRQLYKLLAEISRFFNFSTLALAASGRRVEKLKNREISARSLYSCLQRPCG